MGLQREGKRERNQIELRNCFRKGYIAEKEREKKKEKREGIMGRERSGWIKMTVDFLFRTDRPKKLGENGRECIYPMKRKVSTSWFRTRGFSSQTYRCKSSSSKSSSVS